MTKDDLINPLDQEYTIKLTKREFGLIEDALIHRNSDLRDDISGGKLSEGEINQYYGSYQRGKKYIQRVEEVLIKVIEFNNEIFGKDVGRRVFIDV